MSMILNFARISEELLTQLRENPERIMSVVYPDDGSDDAVESLAEEDMLDIDKSWHAIHYLLTGTAWEGDFPEGFIVACGQVVGDVDLGYGPARFFTASETAEIAEYLRALTNESLKSRMNFEDMSLQGIYPDIWDDNEEPEEEWLYVEHWLNQLREFLNQTEQRGLALLVYMN